MTHVTMAYLILSFTPKILHKTWYEQGSFLPLSYILIQSMLVLKAQHETQFDCFDQQDLDQVSLISRYKETLWSCNLWQILFDGCFLSQVLK